MENEIRQVYSEVYQIINILGDEYIKKLPTKLYKMLESKKDNNYTPNYTIDNLSYTEIDARTISIIALLHLNYWCETEDEKNEIREILNRNEMKFQEQLKEKYNPNSIFEDNIQSEENTISETALVEYKESILKKIIKFLISKFKN